MGCAVAPNTLPAKPPVHSCTCGRRTADTAAVAGGTAGVSGRLLASADFIRQAAGVAQAVSAGRRRRLTDRTRARSHSARPRAFPGNPGWDCRSVAQCCKLPGAASLHGVGYNGRAAAAACLYSGPHPRKGWLVTPETHATRDAPTSNGKLGGQPRTCSSDCAVSIASAPREGEAAAFCCAAAPAQRQREAGCRSARSPGSSWPAPAQPGGRRRHKPAPRASVAPGGLAPKLQGRGAASAQASPQPNSTSPSAWAAT